MNAAGSSSPTTTTIAVPTAIKVYNWVLTLRGHIHLTVPMLFAIGFVFTFINGGLTGLFLGNVTVDVPLSDTYFVVAHFHMVMGVSPILVVFGAIYHWYPKVTGGCQRHDGSHPLLVHLPRHLRDLSADALSRILGVPRRYCALGDTYFIPDSVHTMNEAISTAAFFVAAVQLLFLFNLIWSLKNGKHAGGNPRRATTLEWFTPDTPPRHGNWGAELPVVYRWAYEYGVPGLKDDFVPQNQPPAGGESRSFTATVMATDWARQGSRARAGPRQGGRHT